MYDMYIHFCCIFVLFRCVDCTSPHPYWQIASSSCFGRHMRFRRGSIQEFCCIHLVYYGIDCSLLQQFYVTTLSGGGVGGVLSPRYCWKGSSPRSSRRHRRWTAEGERLRPVRQMIYISDASIGPVFWPFYYYWADCPWLSNIMCIIIWRDRFDQAQGCLRAVLMGVCVLVK